MNNLYLDILHVRQPRLNYVSPAVCENRVDNSSGFSYPVLLLGELATAPKVQGIFVNFLGQGRFNLNWGTVPGAICYTVYKLLDTLDPFGEYMVIAECITDPALVITDTNPGCYVVTALLESGLTSQVSDPVCVNIPDDVLLACYPTEANPCAANPGDWPPLIGGGGGACLGLLWDGPTSITVTEGETATLGPVTIFPGTGTLQYEWWKDGVFFRDTTATTTNSLVIENTVEEDSGAYQLKVFTTVPGCGVLTSPEIILTVESKCPAILAQGDSPVSVAETDPATLGPVTVENSENVLKYEWWKDGVFFSDTTATTQNSLEFPATVTGDAGVYTLKIYPIDTEGCGVIESSGIQLVILACPDWTQIVWDDPSIVLFGAGTGSAFAIQNQITTQSAGSPNGGDNGDAAIVDIFGHLVYNGPECNNCNLHIGMTILGDGVSSDGGIQVDVKDQDLNLVSTVIFPTQRALLGAGPFPSPTTGEFDIPFSVPDTGGQNYTIEIHSSASAGLAGTEENSFGLFAVFTNV